VTLSADIDWQSLYYERLRSLDSKKYPRCALIYLNNDEVPELVRSYNGVCFPAHIDREANGVIATLGVIPENPFFGCVEVRDLSELPTLKEKHPIIKDKLILSGSDAHYLHNMRDKEAYLDLDDEPFSSDKVRSSLFALLRAADKSE